MNATTDIDAVGRIDIHRADHSLPVFNSTTTQMFTGAAEGKLILKCYAPGNSATARNERERINLHF